MNQQLKYLSTFERSFFCVFKNYSTDKEFIKFKFQSNWDNILEIIEIGPVSLKVPQLQIWSLTDTSI